MSRLSKFLIRVPLGTTIILKSRICVIEGPCGSLSQIIPNLISLVFNPNGLLLISKSLLTRSISKQLGLLSRLLKNKILGVNFQFKKKLQVIGVGYRSKVENNKLILVVGYSHSTFFIIPPYIQITINRDIIVITGIDKQTVCLFASKIRHLKPPEPYKGKGIKYLSEILIRKIGKSNKP